MMFLLEIPGLALLQYLLFFSDLEPNSKYLQDLSMVFLLERYSNYMHLYLHKCPVER